MASVSSISQAQPLLKKPEFAVHKSGQVHCLAWPMWDYNQRSKLFSRKSKMLVVAASSASTPAAAEKPKKRYPGEAKGFVEEMRSVAMKLHTKDQAKEGEKEPKGQPVAKWEPSIEGYLKFLVDSKLVYDTLEEIVEKASFPEYAEFQNTGLERSESLAKDLDWFKEQGHVLPEPSLPGISYARYLKGLAEKDPQAFICHFYNIYFAHTAGGRMIGKKVAEKILDKKELEFYKWDGDLSQLLHNLREKLNRVAEASYLMRFFGGCYSELDSRGEEPLFGGNREVIQVFRGYSSIDIVVIQ